VGVAGPASTDDGLVSGGPGATVLAAGTIRPQYRSDESYRFIVIADGKVTALADTAEQAAQAAGWPAFWIDLGSACVGPGFIDTHIHALQAAADVRLVGLREATTMAGLLSAVRQAGLGRPAGEWTVSARNWHESALREGRLPSRSELDALGVPGPVLLRRGSHLAVANSHAIARLGAESLPSGAAQTGRIDSDAVIARALRLAGREQPSLGERRDDLAAVMARLSARGLTTIREAGVDGAELDVFASLRDRSRLSLRCDLLWRIPEGSDRDAARERLAAMPRAGPMEDPHLRLTGVKAFVDGRIADAATDPAPPPVSGADAAIDPGQPFRITPPDLWAIVEESLRRSAGVGCHAVGDAAVRVVLDAYERALSAGLARNPGQLVIEHALNCTPETIRRMAASGVGVSVHPSIVYEFADDIRRHWGAENSARAAPVRDMVEAGVRVAAGSDGDVPPFDPLRGVWFMVTRAARSGGLIGESQALARNVALDLYTRRGADLLGAGTRRGQLRPGMDADLAVFSADPLSCPVEELPDIDVLLTLLGGKPVHDPDRLMDGNGHA
jgi:predicted amidohydrolase YtcJ